MRIVQSHGLLMNLCLTCSLTPPPSPRADAVQWLV